MLSCYFRALRLGGVLTSPQATPSGLQMTPPSLPGTENPGKQGSPDFILIGTHGYAFRCGIYDLHQCMEDGYEVDCPGLNDRWLENKQVCFKQSFIKCPCMEFNHSQDIKVIQVHKKFTTFFVECYKCTCARYTHTTTCILDL